MNNKYLLSGYKGKVEFWRYLLMIVSVFVATQIGSLPYIIVILIKSIKKGIPLTKDISNNELMGIDSNLTLFLMLLTFVFGLLVYFILFKPIHNKKVITSLTGREKFDIGRLFFSMLVWSLLIIASLILYSNIYPGSFHFQLDAKKFIVLIIIVLSFLSLQSMFEEVIFRGYLMQGLSVIFKNAWVPLILTSVVFGVLHILNPEVKEFGIAIMLPQYIILGLLLCITVVMDEGLEIAIGIHAANNILLSLLITHESSTLQTDALYYVNIVDPVYSLIEIIIFSIFFILIMSYKYKWGSLKKLFQKVIPE